MTRSNHQLLLHGHLFNSALRDEGIKNCFQDVLAEYRSNISSTCPSTSFGRWRKETNPRLEAAVRLRGQNEEEEKEVGSDLSLAAPTKESSGNKLPSDGNEDDPTTSILRQHSFRRSTPVLFSSHSPRSRTAPFYCVLPFIVNMDPYGINDLPLGSFLESFCFSDRYKCPNNICDTPMREHIRRFCHNSGSLTMYAHELGNIPSENAPIVVEDGFVKLVRMTWSEVV